ncbi:MAG: exosortase family protein XrtF [Flavobacteriaceae bacterium]|nr:exosortase family protein XrtF [Flavobacteriaceae bacterium]
MLFGIYSAYLHKKQIKTPLFSCAPITQTVANHTSTVAKWFGYHIFTEQHNKELSIKLIVGGNYTARVIEGCNSVSIIILFLAFIIAFTGSLKATIFYGLFGVFLIYSTNILRIIALSLLLYRYPQFQEPLHTLIFPAIIYGLVFILWIIWVRHFSYHKKQKNEEKV